MYDAMGAGFILKAGKVKSVFEKLKTGNQGLYSVRFQKDDMQ